MWVLPNSEGFNREQEYERNRCENRELPLYLLAYCFFRWIFLLYHRKSSRPSLDTKLVHDDARGWGPRGYSGPTKIFVLWRWLCSGLRFNSRLSPPWTSALDPSRCKFDYIFVMVTRYLRASPRFEIARRSGLYSWRCPLELIGWRRWNDR
jgi:hypothetical protein